MVEVSLTGEVTVSGGGRMRAERQLGGRRARLMLAMLVVERHRPVPMAELAEVLWPAGPPASWQPSLREVASTVREALAYVGLDAAAVLQAGHACYRLRLPESTGVDIEIARGRLTAGERSLGKGLPAEAAAAAERAIAVTDRPLLAGEEGSWLRTVRGRLRADLIRGLELLFAARLDEGQPQRAAEVAERLVALEPFMEGVRFGLMRAYVAAGHPPEALRSYEAWRRLLAEELGVDPSTEIQALYRTLLQPPPTTPYPAVPEVAGRAPAALRRLPGPLDSPWPLPFMGRAAERALLARKEREAASRGGVIVLSGETGSGKTRLCGEVAASSRGTVLYGRCDAEPLLCYQPLAEVSANWLSIAPPVVTRTLWARHGSALRRLVPTSGAGEVAADIGPVPPGTLRYRIVEAVAEALATAAPALVVIEDLQWADPGTLCLLPQLARRVLSGCGVLLILTFRDDEPHPGLTAALAATRREGGVAWVHLGGLSARDVTRLARAAGRDFVPGAPPRNLHELTGGNPLYLVQLLSDEAYRRAVEAASGASLDLIAPAMLGEVVRQRVGRLSPPSQDLLAAAAVAGVEFGLDAAGLAAGLDDDELDRAVEEAENHRLLTTTEAGDRCRFVHPIVRVAVCSQVRPRRRAELSRRLAAAMVEQEPALMASADHEREAEKSLAR